MEEDVGQWRAGRACCFSPCATLLAESQRSIGSVEPLGQARFGSVNSSQSDEGLYSPQENLSLGKMSVSRMHSLPNDSYMFRPVRPASAPYPLPEVEPNEGNPYLGSVSSVHSQPCVGSSLLQVPGACPQVQYSNHSLPRIRPPHLCPSPTINRPLYRQVAVKNESVDVQSCDSKENLERWSSDSLHLKVPLSGNLTLPVPRLSAPNSPQGSPLVLRRARALSLRTPRHTYGQHCAPRRPLGLARRHSSSSSDSDGPGPDSSALDRATDPADEEVRRINSSARGWKGRRPSQARCHSLSPYTSLGAPPPPAPLKNCSSATSLLARGPEGPKVSVDPVGLLPKPPSRTDVTRRHSVEICPTADGRPAIRDRSTRSSYHGPPSAPACPPDHRKVKMSPPCISIDPPLEAELSAPTVPLTKSTESTMLLRRRTPSCDSALQRDSLDLQDQQPLIEPLPKAERRPSRHDERLPVPQFSFDQSDLSSLSSMSEVLSDSDQSTHSSSFDTRLEGGANIRPSEDLAGTVAGSPLRKRGLIRIAGTRDTEADDSVV
ncbi:hypothetical protein JZ751_015255 [Albula glossodonta]|uniref:Uncharacterized protein n=1 Tax=Albula glossodonta TaxID=121402 RepID=A0A8T2P300_9TELE|nr:hypothetical protein JZ751_015255 [Albula glossodonta]